MTPDDDTREPSIDAAYRATPRDEPSPELDARILAAAHRAVDARPAPVRRSFAQRWRLPVALAATVVLSVTVTLMMYESERSLQLPAPGSAGKLREEAVPAQKASPRGDTAGNAAKREISEPREQFAAPQADEAQPARAPAAVAPPAVAAPPESAAPNAQKDDEADLARQREKVRDLERKASEQEQELRKSRPASGATPAAAPPQSAPAAAPSRESTMSRERALADRPAERSGRDALGAAAPASLQTPEEWLAEIRRLKAAGRIDEANRLLAEFRERYADFPIPADLR